MQAWAIKLDSCDKCPAFFTLVADESMKVLFDDGNGPVLQACLSWLSSGDQHLEISSCLALGNFGRSGTVHGKYSHPQVDKRRG